MNKLIFGVFIGFAVVLLIALTSVFGISFVLYLGTAIAGIIVAIVLFLLISPLLKEQLLHDPNDPKKLGMFVQVGTGRAVAIDWGGNYADHIDGDDKGPKESTALFGLWMLYKQYVWRQLQLHVYVPFFTEPKTYDLPRYDVIEKDGKRVYEVVGKDNPRYRSNHVRTAPFTWSFEFAGTDIQTVPYTIKGSAQVVIDKTKVKEVLYLTESWNVLLDQALNSVTRSVVRAKVTIDMVIGAVEKNLWTDDAPSEKNTDGVTSLVAELVYQGLMKYRFDDQIGGEFAGKKLADLGIKILKIDITDFEDELTEVERLDLRSSVLGRQKGRARDLQGQGIAKEQEHMAAVLQSLDPDLRESILKNRAFVDAVNKGGSAETLIAALVGHLRK